jgi:hypothetical protein
MIMCWIYAKEVKDKARTNGKDIEIRLSIMPDETAKERLIKFFKIIRHLEYLPGDKDLDILACSMLNQHEWLINDPDYEEYVPPKSD